MDFHTELEDLASAELSRPLALEDDTIEQGDVSRWQELFALTAVEAEQRIREHRRNLNRPHVNSVREKYRGHTKESYEYFLTPKPQSRPRKAAMKKLNAEYLLKLEGPLQILDKWPKELRNLTTKFEIHEATETTEDKKVVFAKIGNEVKEIIQLYFETPQQNSTFKPTFIRLNIYRPTRFI